VAKREKGVEIKIFYKITFVKDGGMRGMISSKSDEEVKAKSELLLAETAKLIKIVGSGGGDGKGKDGGKEEMEEEKETNRSMDSPKMKKL
jgi:hypothetical protein